jgi:hypothetical protein
MTKQTQSQHCHWNNSYHSISNKSKFAFEVEKYFGVKKNIFCCCCCCCRICKEFSVLSKISIARIVFFANVGLEKFGTIGFFHEQSN